MSNYFYSQIGDAQLHAIDVDLFFLTNDWYFMLAKSQTLLKHCLCPGEK